MAEDIYKKQSLCLEDRKRLVISSVTDVESFDDNSISLITSLGVLIIKGADIKIEKLNLDPEEVIATGNFYLMEYVSDENTKSGFFKKMFR